MTVDTEPRIIKKRVLFLFPKTYRLCPFDGSLLTKGKYDVKPKTDSLFDLGSSVTYYDCPKCTYRYEVKR